jgi:hypothetical protein
MKENPIIKKTSELLLKNCDSIRKMFLISFKVDNESNLTSFKLALILDDNTQNLPELECNLYLEVDCEIPYDIVIYRYSEFQKLKEEIGTFAWKIDNSGANLYG